MAADPLVLFVDPACPHCRAVRAFLSSAGIPVQERDVTGSPEMLEDLVWASGGAVVPAVVVGSVVIIGCDFERLSEAVQVWREAAESSAASEP